MRPIQLLTIFILALSGRTLSQEPPWTRKSINEVLSVELPSNHTYDEQEIIKGYSGSIGNDFFVVSFYDTAMKVSSANDFRISVTRFAHGFTKRVPEGQYKITLSDTVLGNTKGILISFMANASAEYPNNMFCYVTLANGYFYSFMATESSDPKNLDLRTHFYSQIRFDVDKIEENKFSVDAVLIK